MLRAAQKMMYFYGFPELDTSGDGVNIDTETINRIVPIEALLSLLMYSPIPRENVGPHTGVLFCLYANSA